MSFKAAANFGSKNYFSLLSKLSCKVGIIQNAKSLININILNLILLFMMAHWGKNKDLNFSAFENNFVHCVILFAD